MNVRTKFEVRSFTRSWDNREYLKKNFRSLLSLVGPPFSGPPFSVNPSSLEDSPMILDSWRLTSARNSKRNIGSEGAEWDRGRENSQFLASKSPCLRNGARQDHSHNEGLIGSCMRAFDCNLWTLFYKIKDVGKINLKNVKTLFTCMTCVAMVAGHMQCVG